MEPFVWLRAWSALALPSVAMTARNDAPAGGLPPVPPARLVKTRLGGPFTIYLDTHLNGLGRP